MTIAEVGVEGFTFGAITDFEAEPCDAGDAFIVAPDGSRAGLVWEVSSTEYIEEVRSFERDRWGVWASRSRSLWSTVKSWISCRDIATALINT